MNITLANFGWIGLAWLAAGVTLSGILNWFTGQYEVTRHGFRLAISRRWYGKNAWVILRAHKDEDEPERFRVLEVDTEDSDVPWLKVGSVDFDKDHLDEDELAEPFWAPVTDFYPEAVRKLRPWIFRYRWLRLPVPFAYETVSRPDGA